MSKKDKEIHIRLLSFDSVPLNGGGRFAKRESKKRVDVNATRVSLRSHLTADTVKDRSNLIDNSCSVLIIKYFELPILFFRINVPVQAGAASLS